MKRKLLMSILMALMLCTKTFIPVLASTNTAELQIEVEKLLTGDKPEVDSTFAFVLESEENTPMPETNTIYITGEGTGSFSPIIYDETQTYYYTLREVNDDKEGYTYDETVYNIVVLVTSDDKGTLTPNVYVYKQSSDLKLDKIAFVNNYTSDPDDQTKPPSTGDITNFYFWFVLAGISLLGLVILTLLTYLKHKK